MIGEKLGSYQVEAVLGSGAMGVVYKCAHVTTGKTAAVKVVSREVAARGTNSKRFERESKILQQFKHPNIVRLLAIGRSQGTDYFAMEYIQGETLEQKIQREGALPWKEVATLGVQIAEALQFAHERHVVHRDLKPSNLMVNERGQIKLTDFGIAKAFDATEDLTATGRTLGTAAYMAPEQIRGHPEISSQTDLYALGVVLYQMLTGQPPFSGGSAVVLMHCHLNEPPPRPSAKVAEIPRALDNLVLKLMAKDPADRPRDALAVATTLTEIRDKAERGETVPMVWPTVDGSPVSQVGGVGIEEPPRKPKKSAGKSRREPVDWLNRATLETGGLVLALIVILSLVGYMLWPPSARYLYRRAEALMASPHRHDWIEARDHFLDPLDRRFPNNGYKETTQAWRDRILIEDVERRAGILQSALHTRLSEPKDKPEHQFVIFSALASDASKQGDDLRAVGVWEEMANQLRPDDPTERPWFLYAQKLASDLKATIARRREIVTEQLRLAAKAEDAGRPREAATIRKDLQDRYGKFTDLADLLGPKPAEGPPSSPDKSTDKG